MNVFALPPRVVFVWIQPPAEHEMRAVLIADLLSLHRPADQVRQLAVGLVAALVGGVGSNGRGFRHTPGARAGIELTLETAKELRAPLDRAIAAAEFEEAEFRGKGAVPSLVRAA